MTYELITALAIYAFVTSITPGPNNTILLLAGIQYGFVSTIPQIIGIGLGFSVMLVASGAGLGEIITSHPDLNRALRYIGGIYILWLTYRILKSGAFSLGNGPQRPLSFLEACIFPWTNPKAWIMAVAAVTTYAPPNYQFYDIFIITLVFTVINVPSIAVWAAFGSAVKRIVQNERALRFINIALALLLILSLYPIVFL